MSSRRQLAVREDLESIIIQDAEIEELVSEPEDDTVQFSSGEEDLEDESSLAFPLSV